MVPEVIGFDNEVILVNKNADELRQHDRVDSTVDVSITRTISGSLVSDPTQMDWIDGDLFVATFAGGNPSVSRCDAGTATTVGEVWLASALAEATSPLDHYALGAGSKPEGIDAVEVDPGSADSCPSSATHVVYVGDFCSDELDVFSVDNAASSPELTYLYSVDLNEDADGTPSSFSGGCHPSSVAYYPATNEVMVVCQARGTIMRLEADAGASDQCAPVFSDVADEVALQRYSSGGNPTCSVNPTTAACGSACQPHDIGFDQFIWPGWIFVNLSDVGQIVAIDQDDMSMQRVIYRDIETFDPRDLDLAASCPPNDPSCVYP